MEWIYLAQDMDRQQSVFHMIMKFQAAYNVGSFLSSSGPVVSVGRILLHGTTLLSVLIHMLYCLNRSIRHSASCQPELRGGCSAGTWLLWHRVETESR